MESLLDVALLLVVPTGPPVQRRLALGLPGSQVPDEQVPEKGVITEAIRSVLDGVHEHIRPAEFVEP